MTTSLEHDVPQALWLVDGAAGLGNSIILRKGNEAKRASCEEAIVICYCGVHAETYFGEWAEDMREQSIGLLDRIKSPRVFLTDHTKALSRERRANSLDIAVAGSGDASNLMGRLLRRGGCARHGALGKAWDDTYNRLCHVSTPLGDLLS